MKIEDSPLREIAATAKSRGELWVRWLHAANVRIMLEVGVWKGDFAKQLLEDCPSIEQYHMIDPWANLPDWNKPLNVKQETFDAAYEEVLKKTAFASKKITMHRGRTKEVIGKVPAESLDLAYIDGDHTLRGITIDLINVLPKIKEGGFIGGDDFSKTPWQHAVWYEPTLVCPFSVYFAEAMNLPIVALPFDQFLIQKRADASFSFTDTTGAYTDLSLNKLRFGWGNMGPVSWAKWLLKRAGF
ncbi:MAG TPA: class I SAM-dependent methyltransferase [Verrucomicrobiae bacterium]|nr:class I SAM-dependent methyltransferase [Verrucomicrobiae bacterium]